MRETVFGQAGQSQFICAASGRLRTTGSWQGETAGKVSSRRWRSFWQGFPFAEDAVGETGFGLILQECPLRSAPGSRRPGIQRWRTRMKRLPPGGWIGTGWHSGRTGP